ncbi:MAG: hypothetical protein ABIS50_18035 [Luteolibacter sp.]|uniref:hypothetical protein n=1 Tax=Luteolibacter sp. TaxID=1962973 RepID=UPI003266D66F
MKRLLLAITSTVIALLLPGCLQSETTIHLNKDGSGTLVEQTTLGAQMMAMMDQMSSFGGADGRAKAKDPVAEMFSPEKAKARAATLGEGVTFEKSEPIEIGGNKGARTTFKFADINKLKIAPGEGMKDMSPMGAAAPATAKSEPIAFKFADGTLTIGMPEPAKPEADKDAKPDAPDMEENPQMDAMMKQMLGDMKMSFKVVVDSGIADTDATNHDGNTVTLMEMEMGKLLEKPETLKKLQAADHNDPQAAMEALKGLEGVKMETKKQVTVKLK